MADQITQLAASCGLFLILLLIGLVLARGQVRWSWLAVALGLFIVRDASITLGWGVLPVADLIPGPWPWESSLLALIVMLLVGWAMFAGRWSASGLVLVQRGPAPLLALAGAVTLCAVFAGAAWWMLPGRLTESPQGLAYTALMPPLEQELFFRGFLLGALDKAFGTPLKVLRAPVGWGAVMSSVLFVAALSVTLTPGLDMVMDVNQAAYLFPAGLALAWLRAASGSVLLPVLVHSWALVCPFVL